MIPDYLLEKVIVNYLYHKKDMSVKDAYDVFHTNKGYFEKVFDLLGEEFISALMSGIEKKI